MKEFERMGKIMENEETLRRCLDNPYRINIEYEEIIKPRPKTSTFEKALHFTGLWSKLDIDKTIWSISYEIEKAVKLWLKTIKKLFNKTSSSTIQPINYMGKWLDEQYNVYYWTINYETKRKLLELLKKAIDNTRGIEKLKIEIVKLNKTLFWKGRATTIAITEIHKAYERWRYTPGRIINKMTICAKILAYL